MTLPQNQPFPFPTAARHDAPPEHVRPVEQEPTETALDSGVEESFPASDPVSVNITKVEARPPRHARLAAPAMDSTAIPGRLRHGKTWVYAALALGLAVGCAVADRGRRRAGRPPGH